MPGKFLNQPTEALMGIKVFTGVIPGVACLLGALLLIWYPLRGERLAKVQDKVLTLHVNKRMQFEKAFSEEMD